MAEKKTECVKVWMGESMFTDLARLAAADERAVSDYIERALRRHVYGHRLAECADEDRPEAGRSGPERAN